MEKSLIKMDMSIMKVSIFKIWEMDGGKPPNTQANSRITSIQDMGD